MENKSCSSSVRLNNEKPWDQSEKKPRTLHPKSRICIPNGTKLLHTKPQARLLIPLAYGKSHLQFGFYRVWSDWLQWFYTDLIQVLPLASGSQMLWNEKLQMMWGCYFVSSSFCMMCISTPYCDTMMLCLSLLYSASLAFGPEDGELHDADAIGCHHPAVGGMFAPLPQGWIAGLSVLESWIELGPQSP